MSDVLDLTPDYANIVAYAGDTAEVSIVTNPPEFTDGAVWAAQVRSSSGSADILETFGQRPITGGMCLILTPEQTDALCDLGAVSRGHGCMVYQSFLGAWDVQVLLPDGTVRTLARGAIRVERDVTR